jgi:hypothetical protein
MMKYAVAALLLAATTVFAQDVQINVPDHADPNLDNATTESETAHALSTSAIVAAWNDSRQFATMGTLFNSIMAWGWSSPDGMSWVDAGPITCPSPWQCIGDPAVVVDNGGNFYVASLISQDGGDSVTGVTVARTTTNVPPFALGTPVVLVPSNAQFTMDKELLAVDRSGGQFDGRVYIAMSQGQFDNIAMPVGTEIIVAHSTSVTPLAFSPWLKLSPTDTLHHGAMPAVGPGGEVYVVWGRYEFTGSLITAESLHIVKSTNGGVSFKNPDAADPKPNKTIATPTPTPGFLGTGTSKARLRDFPIIAVDQTPVGSPTRGNVYVVFNADPDGAGADKSDIFIVRSTNGGVTWSDPRSINAAPAVAIGADKTTRDNWQPAIAVSPLNGHIRVSFYDKRGDAANVKTRLWQAFSTDGGLTWQNDPLSAVDFTPSSGYDPLAKPTYFGDYNWAAADAGGFHFTWGDSRNNCTPPGGAPNPCSPSGRGDQDVWYQRADNVGGPDMFIQPWGAVTGIPPKWKTPAIYCVNGSNQKVNALKGVINHLRAEVRNIGDAAADNAVVTFRYAPWFAGIADSDLKVVGPPITISLTAAGGANDSAIVPIEWDLTDLNDTNGGKWPAAVGTFEHFCVKVTIELAADIAQANNAAQTNFFDVKTAMSLKFLIGNGRTAATAKLIVAPLPAGFRTSILIDGLPPGAATRGFRMEPNEIRLATVRFDAPPDFNGPEDVVSDIDLMLDNVLAGGISARVYRAPGSDKDESALRAATAPAVKIVKANRPPSIRVSQQRRDTGAFPRRTIPAAVKYRRTYRASYEATFRAVVESLRAEGVSLADIERGLVNSKSVHVDGEELRRIVVPEAARHDDGRYLLSFWVMPVAGGTEVGVNALILTDDFIDSPLGGERLRSNGTLETEHLDAIGRLLK